MRGLRTSDIKHKRILRSDAARKAGSMTLTRPTIIGIVNMTDDSFSDGGLYLNPDIALERALQLYADGADIIELGAASSAPDAKEVAPDEEIRRLEPLVAGLNERSIALCVDSFQPAT